ncbi:T-cell immunoreceptor with Ig and ITIM domains [Rhynchonycteris naso]
MQWCLLLIWAQGLRQAPLPASGAMTGRIVTVGNISAEEGGSVTLQCHLSSTTAKVTQVNWEQQNRLLAIHHTNLGWYISPAFQERVVPGPRLGLTLQALTMNDTGEYDCVYHTFPDGIYRGQLFLEVVQSSGAEHGTRLWILFLGVALLVVICTAVTGVVTAARKVMTLAVHLSPGHAAPAVLDSFGFSFCPQRGWVWSPRCSLCSHGNAEFSYLFPVNKGPYAPSHSARHTHIHALLSLTPADNGAGGSYPKAVEWAERTLKFLRIHSAESGLGREPSGQEEWGPSIVSSPGNGAQAAAASAGLCRGQRGDDYVEPHDYFNVLTYRSLGDISPPAETG